MATKLSEIKKIATKRMKEHFNNTANTKEGTDGQELKIETDCNMGL